MPASSHSHSHSHSSRASDTPFRILHTEWSDGFGGQERRILAEMEGMIARGNHCLLVTRPHAQIAPMALKRGIPVKFAPFRNRFDLATVRFLKATLLEGGFQFLNTHSSIDAWLGCFAAKLAGVKLIRTRHLDLPLNPAWYAGHSANDAIIACGQQMRSRLINTCGFPAEKVVSIPTGINFEQLSSPLSLQFSRQENRQRLQVSDQECLILMLGILRDGKRHDIALKALKNLLDDDYPVRLIVAGDGPVRERLIAQAADLGIAAKVSFLGHCDAIADLFVAADLALLTSESEGVPQAITQGLGFGLPTVATAVGGVPELITDQLSGILIPPNDVTATTKALRLLIDDPEKARQLGQKAKADILENFSLARMLDKTEALYRGLLETPRT